MRIIIYGIGPIFSEIFNNKYFIETRLPENGIVIVGFSDGNKAAWGKIFTCQGKCFEVTGIQMFAKDSFDTIAIASTTYYSEIKNRLLKRGYQKEQVLSLADLYYDQCFPAIEVDRKRS